VLRVLVILHDDDHAVVEKEAQCDDTCRYQKTVVKQLDWHFVFGVYAVPIPFALLVIGDTMCLSLI
jgi:hypothetical protein